jgi:hypothetical protein
VMGRPKCRTRREEIYCNLTMTPELQGWRQESRASDEVRFAEDGLEDRTALLSAPWSLAHY